MTAFPYGYVYPNEWAEPLVWMPVVATYMLLISIASGTAMVLGLAVAFRHGPSLRYVPMASILAVASAAALLLGPMADLRHPERATLVFTNPHIAPNDAQPGSSLIALLANLWAPFLVLIVLVSLLALSADMLAAGRRALALGLSSMERYPKYFAAARALSVPLAVLAFIWAVYGGGLLFSAEALLYMYNVFPLLPAVYLAQSLAVGAGAVILASLLAGSPGATRGLALALALSSLGAAAMRLLELFRAYLLLGGVPQVEALASVLGQYIWASTALFLAAGILGLLNRLAPAAGILAVLGTLIDRWGFFVELQRVSKTGLAVLGGLQIGPVHYVEAASILLVFLGLSLLASLIIPVKAERVGGHGQP